MGTARDRAAEEAKDLTQRALRSEDEDLEMACMVVRRSGD